LEMTKTGTVIQSTGKWYKVASGGDIVDCRLPGKFRLQEANVTNPVAVGDKVDFTTGSDGTGSVTKIHSRENYIPRHAVRHKHTEQILVANVDQGWVVQSVRNPRIKTGFIDRFLVTCEAYEIDAGIVFNKTDLANPKDKALLDDLTDLYQGLQYDVLHTSVFEPDSIKPLEDKLAGKMSVFIGQSGVGKTSIINAIDSELNLRVGEISQSTKKGKHTTTFARLLTLANGGYIVDTPGIRELSVVNIEPYELSLYFPEMLEPRKECRFYNCTHSHEPGCAVIEAFENSDIHPERYQSYLSILEEIEE
jgi:ribosome biogenesis GTPase / thiamine phosphate phosphatase